MKILIFGSDGYIGYPLTQHLLKKRHRVGGIDNYSRRRRVHEIGSDSLTPISTPTDRRINLRNQYTDFMGILDIPLGKCNAGFIRSTICEFKPDCIVHLAEQASAPWSMRDVYSAGITQEENILGTLDLLWAMKEECPNAHLVKIGTMGEYGTPNCDIPEGFIPEDCIGNEIYKCSMSGLLFPRQPGSFYHLSKVHDTYNIKFACDTWGLCSTDIMQGVVFGVKVTGQEKEHELTRFDYDQYFGTAINRFCVQALCNHPLTIYGDGTQTRGYIPLKDSIQCLTIAIENPPDKGQYRTWNQFENVYSIKQLADMICNIYNGSLSDTEAEKLAVQIHIENPRVEAENNHYYNPKHDNLLNLGYEPTDIEQEISSLLSDLEPYKNRIIRNVIMPTITWC